MVVKPPLLLILPALLFAPGCLAVAVGVVSAALEEPAPDLCRHYATDFERAYAACWSGLTSRGYAAPAALVAPERGVARIRVQDVAIDVSRLSADLTRVQARLGGFSGDDALVRTQAFLDELDRRLE